MISEVQNCNKIQDKPTFINFFLKKSRNGSIPREMRNGHNTITSSEKKKGNNTNTTLLWNYFYTFEQ